MIDYTIHANVDLGKQEKKHILNLGPQDALAYVLFSNIYTLARRLGFLTNVRKRMKEKGLEKVTKSYLD